LVISSGVAMSVMSLSTLRSLQATQETYSERFRFADVLRASNEVRCRCNSESRGFRGWPVSSRESWRMSI
jgi:hypothetical protein